ncbi:MAG: hypothetical protein K9K66_03985 [Desulfarculaceae bacterium]|nr:hypothetical protein [Desulfarculaceae bacterium]MCF8073201.1 hypothetical protein [Desulfarculaceae bacterium]MCF8100797.1 hypothetical protein [Desulfarculaceae bacterium]MCF8118444.1 hypothetical protein [Desulfarculaceae bacterium]
MDHIMSLPAGSCLSLAGPSQKHACLGLLTPLIEVLPPPCLIVNGYELPNKTANPPARSAVVGGRGIAVREHANLDEHPGIVLYFGWLNLKNSDVQMLGGVAQQKKAR